LRAGEQPSAILTSYPHLTPAGLYDAISFYFDHKDEIDRSVAESTLEAVAEEHGLAVRNDGRVVPRTG
jgi:hypothetical protein